MQDDEITRRVNAFITKKEQEISKKEKERVTEEKKLLLRIIPLSELAILNLNKLARNERFSDLATKTSSIGKNNISAYDIITTKNEALALSFTFDSKNKIFSFVISKNVSDENGGCWEWSPKDGGKEHFPDLNILHNSRKHIENFLSTFSDENMALDGFLFYCRYLLVGESFLSVSNQNQ